MSRGSENGGWSPSASAIRRGGRERRAESLRKVAASMLEQRVQQAQASGVDIAKTSPSSGVGSLYPVWILVFVIGVFGLTLGLCLFFDAAPAVRLLALSSAPVLSIAGATVHASGLNRRRLVAQTVARFTDEVAAMPEDGTIAMQRAENLIDRANIEGRILTLRLLRDLFLFGLLATPSVALAAFVTLGDEQPLTVVAGLLFDALALGGFLISRQRVHDLEGDRRQADYERSLLVEDATPEERAEKLFLRQQFELKRYYDETLRQSAVLSYVGIVCVAGGLTVIGVAFYLVVNKDESTRQIVIAALGIAGGILANFVAIVFLRMHSETVAALTSFHERLVGTHHVHFANLLASRIEGRLAEEQRQVIADMAVALSVSGSGAHGNAGDSLGVRRPSQ